MQGEVAAGGATPRAAGEDDRIHSGSDPKLHHEFGREAGSVLSEIIAEALASGVLLVGGRFRLCGTHLRRGAGR